MSKPIMDYLGDFLNYAGLRRTILESIMAYFKVIKTEPGMSEVCGEMNPCDNSLALRLFDFNILIKIDICISKDVGLVKWYHVESDSDKEKSMKLIIKDTFDQSGVIKTADTAKMKYDSRNLTNYCFDTLSQYFEKVDEMTINEKTF